ncbi:hypothetical protein [Lichenicola sp.]|uniref:hypothetical protein n=1 Tax=Lichenicola sp. TaxID=2804529 RepID=UPI003AFFA733
MPFTLAYLDSPVPGIPLPPGQEWAIRGRPVDRQEHFGTEQAALKRAAELLPAPAWRDLRLFGPDGRRLASQAELTARFCVAEPEVTDPPADLEIP